MKKMIGSMLFILISVPAFAQDITGEWNGVLNVMGTQLRLVFHIDQSDTGYSARFDSPDQGVNGIPFSVVSYEEPRLELNAANIGATYRGTVSPDSIQGTWVQGGQSFPLNLFRETVERTQYRRPQYPVRPYPYHEEEVVFRNVEDSLELAGTLTMPDKSGSYPALILISGSGPQNRDEEVFGHKPFLVLADHLTRQGFAVLRYDDRGTAESTGNYQTATTADFAEDALSAVAYLKTRKEIDQDNIGLIGHSEGAIIAPLAANRSDDIAYLVLLAGTGIPGREISLLQAESFRTMENETGANPEEVAFFRNFNEKMIEIAASGQSMAEKRTELLSHYNDAKPMLETQVPEGTEIDQFINRLVDASLAPWMQYFYNYNPSDELEKITIPVLSLNGSNDIQVNAEINQSAIRHALERAGNSNYRILELEGINHMFQESESSSMSEYAAIEQTFSPRALEVISRWVKDHIK